MKENQLRELVLKLYRMLACGMIDHGQLLETDAVIGSEGIKVLTRAHREDHGKILGKGGATFRAFRTILGLVGYRANIAVRLMPLRDPVVGERAIFQPPMTPAENWNSTEIKGWLERTLDAVLQFPYELEVVEDDISSSTAFVVHIDRREKLPLVTAAFLKELSIIFNAIGNNKGRHISVASERPKLDEPKGTVAAAGKRIGSNPERA